MMRKLVLLAAAILLPACDCGGTHTEGRTALVELGSDLQFGTLSVGRTRTLKLQVANGGNATVAIEGFEVPAPFSVAAEVPLVLTGGESAEIEVTYAPTEPNPSAGENHVADLVAVNDGDVHRVSVKLVGHATQPRLVFTPPALDFGEVEAGTIKDLTVTLENRGTEPAVVREARLDSSVFAGELSKLETTLQPGAKVVAGFTYTPAGGGADEVSLVLVTDMHLQPELPYVLRGKGLAASLTLCYGLDEAGVVPLCLPREDAEGNLIYAGELDLGGIDEGLSSRARVTLTNEGNTQVALAGLLTDGRTAMDMTAKRNPCAAAVPAADFGFVPASFGTKLPEDPTEAEPNPPRSQTIEVTYAPHHECAADLSDTAKILVRAGTGAAAKTFSLDLRGASRIGLVHTENLFWQVDRPEQRPYSVYNVGAGPLAVSAVEIVEGDEGVNNPVTDCTQRCADRVACDAGSTRVECSAFGWADGPFATEIPAGTSQGPTGAEVGLLLFDPPPACGTGADPCSPIFKACARILSDDPYRGTICAELKGMRLSP